MADEVFAPSEGKSLKSSLHGWRELCVIASKLLKWEQPYYPVIVFSIITWLFLFVWYLDPSVVTGVSVALLVVGVLDYIVPLISPFVFSQASWNSQKEKEFSSACAGLGDARAVAKKAAKSLRKLKDSNPWLYVAVSTASLSTLAWLGSQMHNLMLGYFVAIVTATVPGLAHHGLLSRGAAAAKRLGKKSK